MLRAILSIVAGVVAAFVIVMLGDMLSHAVAASSAGAPPSDMTDRAAIEAYMAGLPTTVFAVMLAGWTIAAFAAAFVAARFGRKGAWPGWVAAGVFLCATGANLLMIPHPVWMSVAGVVLVVVGGWIGARLGAKAVPAA
ncbi:hypothetical protein N0B44_19010 [Roseibacterium beibuensis]|uniref:hypothetical protein n=1 Tax=[Roseibacterium] beibuensis TaxID=1193142 RepID=UPI00217CF54F|nr:hypothetical protein [Roseibacterium beibuensis]MCS6625009.1 hypothetical protein [Roseibacterium beibuensis]